MTGLVTTGRRGGINSIKSSRADTHARAIDGKNGPKMYVCDTVYRRYCTYRTLLETLGIQK